MRLPSSSQFSATTRAPSRSKIFGPTQVRGAERAVDDDRPAAQVGAGGDQLGEVVVDQAARLRHDPDVEPGRARQRRVRVDQRFDLVLDGVRELEPVGAEELDPVVFDRVVRGRDHHAGRGLDARR